MYRLPVATAGALSGSVRAGPIGVWEIFLYSGTSAVDWTIANGGNPLRSLQRHSQSMFGGCHIATVDGEYSPMDASGKYAIWYHAGENGNLPTDIYHATYVF